MILSLRKVNRKVKQRTLKYASKEVRSVETEDFNWSKVEWKGKEKRTEQNL